MKAGKARFRLLHFQATATFGGDESNSLLLSRELSEMDHHIAVYFGGGPMEEEWRDSGASVTLLGLTPPCRREIIDAVSRTVAETRPDGVFLSSIVLLPLVLKGLGGFRGPTLCHTGNPDFSSLAVRLKFIAAQWMLRPTVTPVMVHCSDYVRKSYQENPFYRKYRHVVAVSAGLVARNGEHAHHHPREISGDMPIRMGMVARLDPIKNHGLVIRAFRIILNSFPQAVLELIGEGAEGERLRLLAEELGVAKRVVFHGRLPSPFPVAAGWDLFLYATTRAEGFGAALAEAMALGLPCVVTDVGPMREVGGEFGAVRYVDPDSAEEMAAAAVEVLRDRGRRNLMSVRSRERVRAEFDSAQFAGKIRACLTV
jgi:glycosyltransferase involved in cell wall biosynthesis